MLWGLEGIDKARQIHALQVLTGLILMEKENQLWEQNMHVNLNIGKILYMYVYEFWLQLEEEKNVYDVVDEGEYSEMVRQRQEDDWIVDDGEILMVTLLCKKKLIGWFLSMYPFLIICMCVLLFYSMYYNLCVPFS